MANANCAEISPASTSAFWLVWRLPSHPFSQSQSFCRPCPRRIAASVCGEQRLSNKLTFQVAQWASTWGSCRRSSQSRRIWLILCNVHGSWFSRAQKIALRLVSTRLRGASDLHSAETESRLRKTGCDVGPRLRQMKHEFAPGHKQVQQSCSANGHTEIREPDSGRKDAVSEQRADQACTEPANREECKRASFLHDSEARPRNDRELRRVRRRQAASRGRRFCRAVQLPATRPSVRSGQS